MQRLLHWTFFLLFTVFVFAAGAVCGIYWQKEKNAALVVMRQPEKGAPPGAESGKPLVPALSSVPATAQKPPLPGAAPETLLAGKPARPEPQPEPQPETPLPAPALPQPLASLPEESRAPGLSASLPEESGFAAPGRNEARKTDARPESSLTGGLEERLPFTPSPYGFSLRKLGPGNGNTLMVVGGIQGDEPGGFSAAALIASHYTITSGAVWVVPDLNFPSILDRSRGTAGDMNRKFAQIRSNDPDYSRVMGIKSFLLDERVSLILNLHDGSGFYRPTWEDGLRNPRRWGQSVIIDQEEMQAPRFNRLYETACLVEEEVNKNLLDPNHRYHIYNTYTSDGNEEMAKTLSYFAICNGKPAFGVEASKEIRPEYRAYYHLRIIEAFMRQMDIGFTRDFPLTPEGVVTALNSNLKLSIDNNRLFLELENIRPTLSMVPFSKGPPPQVRASKPLLALVPEKNPTAWRVAYGNRTLTRLLPLFLDFDYSLDSLEMELDGKPRTVPIGERVSVKNSFLVRHMPGFRVNAIGAQKERNGTEADVLLLRDDFMPRFSIDRDGTTYRVEIYKGNAFAGMVLVRFDNDAPVNGGTPLTATGGRESALGF